MKRLLTPRKALAVLVMGLGTNTFGLSTGALHGTPAVGRPLDVTAPVQFDAPDTDGRCTRVEVFYGDTAVPADRVSVTVHRNEMSATSHVRIVSPKVVDEPVVTVVVHAGCQQSVVRRFVMLADPPGADTQLASAMALGVAPRLQAPATPQAIPVARAPERAARTARVKNAQAPVAAGPRLRLDAAVGVGAGVTDRAGWLRVSHQLEAQPTGDATRRAAAALLWQAINAQPQDLLRMSDRMRSLESEMASLRSITTKQRADLDRLRNEGGLSSGWIKSWPVIAGLLALIAAATGLAQFRRARVRSREAAEPWYEPSASMPVNAAAAGGTASSAPPLPLRAVIHEHAAARRAAEEPLDLSLDATPPGTGEERAEPGRPRFDEPQPVKRAVTPAAGLKTSALADVLHECEFLVSLDGTDRAVDVLRNYIDRCSQAPALALLELRELCRRCGDSEGVAAVEDEYRARFGEDAPREDGTTGLEGCEAALARITQSWPAAGAGNLAIIEDLLFGSPAALGGFPSLHAWRDLLWLHGLAEDTLRGASGAAEKTLEDHAEMTLEKLQAFDFEPAPARSGLDLSLAKVDTSLHRVLDQQDVPQLPPPPEPSVQPPAAPAGTPRAYEDFFDAVGAAEGRALHLR